MPLFKKMGDMKMQLNIAWLVAGSLTVSCCLTAAGQLLAPDNTASRGTGSNAVPNARTVNTRALLALSESGNSRPKSSSARNKGRQKADASQLDVYPVSDTVLAIEVPAPAVIPGRQQPYVSQPEDTVASGTSATGLTQQLVVRAGKTIGELVGPSSQILYTYDQVEPSTFNLAAADAPASYVISSSTDSDYKNPILPVSVFRKTKPTNFATQPPPKKLLWPAKHTLFLSLASPLKEGQTYQLSFPGLNLEEISYQHDLLSRSEAVHVSQLGFRPDDPLKVGYLSTWMGNGGGLDYTDGLPFHLVDTQTDMPSYSAKALLIRPQQQTEDPRGQDYTLTEVHQLDFSDFKQPGEYRLCVESVGCSFPFEISQQAWQQAFFTAARGFYHQRSGIKIGWPYTEFSRPRAFHPDDGVKVYQAEVSLLEVDMGLGSRPTFESLADTKTNQIVSDAWGGYFDAGDWDRRIQHLSIPRGLLELHNLFPDYFKAVELNIPESGNAFPDLLDEALWSLDFFRRLQTADGGIRGGIETTEHPPFGEASWQSSLPVMAYAPDVWSSYLYAGVAARAAHTLASYDSQLAATYKDSAIKAMAYAEKNYPEYQAKRIIGERQHHVKDQRNLAALELYRLTQDNRWHDIFLATTVFQDARAEPYVYSSHEQRDAAFLYARLKDLAVDQQIQANARASFLRYADSLVSLTKTTAFGWSKEHPESPLGWGNGLGAPKGISLLRSHALTQDSKYLLAALHSTQFSGGANPDNMVFTTGLGDRSPQNPLVIDQRLTNQPPPPGITLYGPADLDVYSSFWTIQEIADTTFPKPTEWPAVETGFDIYLYPLGSEFTVDYMLSSSYTWGYLAAREKS